MGGGGEGRYYDPALGRFNTPDPIGFAGGDVNLYRYVSNNPIAGIDPSGNQEGEGDDEFTKRAYLPASTQRCHHPVDQGFRLSSIGEEKSPEKRKRLDPTYRRQSDDSRRIINSWAEWSMDRIGLRHEGIEPNDERTRELIREAWAVVFVEGGIKEYLGKPNGFVQAWESKVDPDGINRKAAVRAALHKLKETSYEIEEKLRPITEQVPGLWECLTPSDNSLATIGPAPGTAQAQINEVEKYMESRRENGDSELAIYAQLFLLPENVNPNPVNAWSIIDTAGAFAPGAYPSPLGKSSATSSRLSSGTHIERMLDSKGEYVQTARAPSPPISKPTTSPSAPLAKSPTAADNAAPSNKMVPAAPVPEYPVRVNPLTGQLEELRPSNAGTGPNRWQRVDKTPVAGELRRPYIRDEVYAEVARRAPRDAQGRFIDPNTGEPIIGTPDVGHKPGHEFWREKAKAKAEGLNQQQFNDRMNNPDLYQLEDPISNRSHQFEKPK